MKNKYFTPDIEDLHIGYECEKKCSIIGENSTEVEQVWLNYTIHYDKDFINIKNDIVDYRVPYLTKEQIEAEGWVYKGKISTRNMPPEPFNKIELEFIKDNLSLSYDIISNILKIFKVIDITKDIEYKITTDLFYGECKDINTFRKIIKLLGI